MSGRLRITLVKGLSGRRESLRRVVRGLGLTRLHRTVEREDTPQIRGMVEKAKVLLRVEEAGEAK
ncbi:MAG: 50S ribosomal protein L30 [Deltaproteobacteria bacterium]|nr:50S ribosomal protein L30 [Deltaproteobacteria bacterium]